MGPRTEPEYEAPEWMTQTMKHRLESYANAMAQEQVLEHLRARTSSPWSQPSAILGVMGLVITIGGALALGGVAWSNSNKVPELASKVEDVRRDQVRNEEQHKAMLEKSEAMVKALDRLERRLGTKPASQPSPYKDDP